MKNKIKRLFSLLLAFAFIFGLFVFTEERTLGLDLSQFEFDLSPLVFDAVNELITGFDEIQGTLGNDDILMYALNHGGGSSRRQPQWQAIRGDALDVGTLLPRSDRDFRIAVVSLRALQLFEDGMLRNSVGHPMTQTEFANAYIRSFYLPKRAPRLSRGSLFSMHDVQALGGFTQAGNRNEYEIRVGINAWSSIEDFFSNALRGIEHIHTQSSFFFPAEHFPGGVTILARVNGLSGELHSTTGPLVDRFIESESGSMARGASESVRFTIAAQPRAPRLPHNLTPPRLGRNHEIHIFPDSASVSDQDEDAEAQFAAQAALRLELLREANSHMTHYSAVPTAILQERRLTWERFMEILATSPEILQRSGVDGIENARDLNGFHIAVRTRARRNTPASQPQIIQLVNLPAPDSEDE